MYNDSIFGGVAWSRDESKILFIGEKPEPATYKNYWEDAKKKEEGQEEEKKKPEEEKPQAYLDEKYKYMDDFGETLVSKKRPTIFVFDLKDNLI